MASQRPPHASSASLGRHATRPGSRQRAPRPGYRCSPPTRHHRWIEGWEAPFLSFKRDACTVLSHIIFRPSRLGYCSSITRGGVAYTFGPVRGGTSTGLRATYFTYTYHAKYMYIFVRPAFRSAQRRDPWVCFGSRVVGGNTHFFVINQYNDRRSATPV